MKENESKPVAATAEIDEIQQQVMSAMALLWTLSTRNLILSTLRRLNLKHSSGRLLTQEEVKYALQLLQAKKWVTEDAIYPGYFLLNAPHRNLTYHALLAHYEPEFLRQALFGILNFNPNHAAYSWPLYDRDQTAALIRILILTGVNDAELQRLESMIARIMDWDSIIKAALLIDFSAATFERLAPAMCWRLTYHALGDFLLNWDTDLLPVVNWARQQLEAQAADAPVGLRLYFAEIYCHRGEIEKVVPLIDGLHGSFVDLFNAYILVQKGKWAEAQTLFEAALKARQKELGEKKRVFPLSLAWIYPLILLAQAKPKNWEIARKFCVIESGKREPNTTSGWGQWVHAIDIRRGDADPDVDLFRAVSHYKEHVSIDHLWRILLAAWLGIDAGERFKSYKSDLYKMAEYQLERLEECEFHWLADLVKGAVQILKGEMPPPGYFVAGRTEHWRELLAALQVLGEEKNAAPTAETQSGRIVWLLDIGKDGSLKGIEPQEQKKGVRGWNKSKPISLAKITANTNLSPADAKLLNCIRVDKFNRRISELELSKAIQALVGHPAVALLNRPEQFVELSEGTPEIEVVHQGDQITLQVTPPLREASTAEQYYANVDDRREAEALRLITLVQESSQRLRLIHFSPSQRRAAQLLADKVTIPASAQQEVQAAMTALTKHFQLQADHLEAAKEVACEALLRAELSPLNNGLLLRLVATPLGADGPRIVPGRGRSRLIALLAGESHGTTRDLALEKQNLDNILNKLSFLEDCGGDAEHAEWEVADPEDALALVEALPKLPEVAALDWPKGKPVRVVSVDVGQLSVSVKSERDWFKIEGEAKVEEGMVFTFSALLEASQNNSRFIAMGNGVYAALTKRLKEQLSDLASVTETDKHGARIPQLAAAWMDDALDGVEVAADQAFLSAIEKLRDTQTQVIPLPKSLQAELRPYQEDGYLWASRLAAAGFGACLADDMGLGKTLQSLALLLARAEGGAALIIAPTSVCGNWVAEAARFAPSLRVHLFSEADRAAVINDAVAFDAVVVSYALLQQASDQFAAKTWHTLIADEAQFIKNSTTKRTQAVFELNANFRLALSGTPVENRLAELWSIMRFVNPGLLGSLPRFNERFAIPIERDKDRDAQHTLRRLIAPFLLRRTKTQVLQELPSRTELLIKINPSTEEASHYEALRRQAIAEADLALATGKGGQARMNILAQLTRLRRAACDPRIVTPTFPAVGSKVQTFVNLALELVANGHKALVFSQFVDFLTLMRQALDQAGIPSQYLDGATPAAERTKRVAAFQAGQCDLFLISLKAGGFGLNLTAADYVVITDPWWNPAAEDQAMGRAHRMGQLRPVTVYRLVMQGTVEEHIVGLHNDKRALAECILGEGDAVNLPSTEELISLIKGD